MTRLSLSKRQDGEGHCSRHAANCHSPDELKLRHVVPLVVLHTTEASARVKGSISSRSARLVLAPNYPNPLGLPALQLKLACSPSPSWSWSSPKCSSNT